MTNHTIVPLGELSRTDIAFAGGKGANLGELARAGFPVPGGFVLTTKAYDRFVEESGLAGAISRALSGGPEEQAGLGTLFRSAAVPPSIETGVREAYRALGSGPVAVRSSATAEDLPDAAFAGQQDTYLNVIGEEAVIAAVRQCWASLWNERAVAYRRQRGIPSEQLKLAVVVQRLVSPNAAGVMFTANPLSGARDEIVIDATPGLGEGVVSGLASPDHFILRKGLFGYRVLETHPGRHEVVIRPRSGGGTEEVAHRGGPALPLPVLGQLAKLGAKVDKHFGSPQDIEWAWADKKLFLLQSRPITALPQPDPKKTPFERMAADRMAEIIPVRPYPLDATGWAPGMIEVIAPVFRFMGFEIRPFDDLFVYEDGVPVRHGGKALMRPTWRLALAPARLAWNAFRYAPADLHTDPELQQALQRARELEAIEPAGLSFSDLLSLVRKVRSLPALLAGEPRSRYLPRAGLSAGALQLALAFLGKRHLSTDLISGLETQTTRANRVLTELSEAIRADPELHRLFAENEAGALAPALESHPSGDAFLSSFRAFLHAYGHREDVVIAVLQPTWRDAPEVVLGMLKGMVSAGPHAAAPKPAHHVAEEQLHSHPAMGFSPLRAAVQKLVHTARHLQQIREDTHYHSTLPLPTMRRLFLEVGKRFTDIEVTSAPEEVFHMRWDELESLAAAWPPDAEKRASLRSLIARRRARREELASVPFVDVAQVGAAENAGNVLVRGIPGGPGRAEGRVCIVMGPADFAKLRPGDVLVAPFTNPGWTPLFRNAVAVVADTGSAMSHAVIVAREHGIPAIMNTVDGTRKLQDGQRVRVDGRRGLVFAI